MILILEHQYNVGVSVPVLSGPHVMQNNLLGTADQTKQHWKENNENGSMLELEMSVV